MISPEPRWAGDMPQREGNPRPISEASGVEPGLQDVERLLAREARRHAPPPDLAERIFIASVGRLPGRPATPPLRAIRPALAGRFPVLGRLALAASITLAFVVTSVITTSSGETFQPVVVHDEDVLFPQDIADMLIVYDMRLSDVTREVAMLGERGMRGTGAIE